jgi:DNA-binding beta-propeller fold protein YncE
LLILVLGVTRSLLAGPDAAASGNVPLRIVADISMPGPAVRFDYQSLDQDQGRLYISHMNADQLVVFDTTTRQVVANLDGFKRVHGVWAVPTLGRVYASASRSGRCSVSAEARTFAYVVRGGSK